MALVFFKLLKESQNSKAIVFVVVISSLIVGNYLGAWQQRRDALSVFNNVQNTTLSYLEQVVTRPDEDPKLIELKPDVTTATGDLASVEKFVHATLTDFAKSRNEYLTDLEASGWFALLDINRLREDAQLVETHQIVAKAELILTSYYKNSMEMVDGLANRVEHMEFESEQLRGHVKQGVANSAPKTRANTQRLLDLEVAAFRGDQGDRAVAGEAKGAVRILSRAHLVCLGR